MKSSTETFPRRGPGGGNGQIAASTNATVVFEDVKEKLSFGLLYFTYYSPVFYTGRQLQNATMLAHMFPISVHSIGPGLVAGFERIITLHSGVFGWPDESDVNATVVCFDENGASIAAPSWKRVNVSFFELAVPVEGACILVREEGGLK